MAAVGVAVLRQLSTAEDDYGRSTAGEICHLTLNRMCLLVYIRVRRRPCVPHAH